ncbi:Dolichyl-phosphate-mannose-protein mannosyltransferase family protein OS=uncultured planctomycete GN=HGMM_F12C05C10 PE=4 SV=1: PMT_2: PMT_2 [Gemmata massiliana]|uniref:Glycosyltransferase RgtA/B/C/D-like domain-containing protein n=1 Tax=Gemmata massiliana TaxID=1210884 RepID=A0A6P2D3R8_9BACT|nr:glycosyltransferase family 39 protein [Gemmata massiliana]VTR95733.1 Dolichyl-phosphate-mannose-protein mannosyltransferase family protein OS=uncultured planctomycete GN=HGMM_F12C05C10 PE=4 SV=1: PMT_2: PMT_2 [Gemmata massiliana]
MVPSLNPVAVRVPAGAPDSFAWKLTDRACKRTAFGLILASVVFHLLYLAFNCPLDLSPDEAHYWQWSRHLAWSYYSKGPLVAWLIRASCELFGPASEALTGSLMFAVRLPAVACHAALLAGWYVLAASTLKSHRAALATVALAMTLPPVIAGAVLMTIDPPFLACWCWAAIGVWKGLERGKPNPQTPFPRKEGGAEPEIEGGMLSAVRSPSPLRGGVGEGFFARSLLWWLLAAICSALGVLAKYPMVLLPCGVFGYLLFTRRDELKRPGFWVFALGSALGLVPVLLWNWANDWVTFRHVGTQAAGTSGSGIRWLGPLTFAVGQAGFLIGVWFVVWVVAAWRARRATDPAVAFLWWTSVPVWSVFAVASFKASGQINWPAAAYVTGFVLCVAWVRDQLGGRNHKFVARFVSGGVAVGLALSTLVHYPGLMRSALASAAGAPTEKDPTPIRKLDPTARLRGWKTLAREVDAIRARVRAETGEEPLVAGTVWNVPGALGVYCSGHPETYSFGLAMADRHSQYDVWHPNPVADAQAFRGRTFVFVGDGLPSDAGVFGRVEQPTLVFHHEEGIPVAVWWVWVGHDFRGFPDKPLWPGRPRY